MSDDIDLSEYEDSDDVCPDCGALKLDDICDECYATPTFTYDPSGRWRVSAAPWDKPAGVIEDFGTVGWTASAYGRCIGLFPTQQAAGEALVRHAGYEVLG